MRFVKTERTGDAGIVLYGRDEEERHKFEIADFEPYFYAPVDEARRKKDEIPQVSEIEVGDYETIRGDSVAKVFVSSSRKIPDVAERFSESYESDVLYTKRFRLDSGIVDGFEVPDKSEERVRWQDVKPVDAGDIPLRLLHLDIETRRLPQGEDFDDATVDILSISLYDSAKDEFHTLIWHPDREDELQEDVFLSEWRSEFFPVNIRWWFSEKEMLEGFVELFNKINPDLVGGWNSEDFDLPYIFNRLEHFNIDPNMLSPQGNTAWWEKQGRKRCKIKGRVVFDYLSAYAKLVQGKLGSRKLEDVATDVLGVGKLGDFGGEVDSLWRNDPMKLVKYNITDVDLVAGIDQLNRSPRKFAEDLLSFSLCGWRDFYWNSVLVDSFILSRRGEHQILPTKTTHNKGKEFKGGFVKTPSQSGVLEGAWVLDLRRMYPSIILSANMSPETLVREDSSGADTVEIPLEYVSSGGNKDDVPEVEIARFSVDEKGFLPKIIEEAFELRDKVDRKLEETEPGTDEHEAALQRKSAVKRVINSFYGVLSFRKSRLFSPKIPTATTALGRKVIEETVKVSVEEGDDVIYGDTDSVMVSMDSKEEARELEKKINQRYDELAEEMGMSNHKLEIELEKRYDKVFFKPDTKKRYCGLVGWEDGTSVEGNPEERLDVTGFEYKRSDSPRITKSLQEKLFLKALEGDTDDLTEYVCDIAEDFRHGEIDVGDIAVPCGIGKPLEEYEVASVHVKAARNANEHLGTNYGPGDKIRYVYLDRTPEGVPNFSVIALDRDGKLPGGYEIDYREMFRKTVVKKAEPIFSALGIEDWESEAENKLRGQTSMADFAPG